MPGAALWVGRYAPWRWPYYLLPQGELVPLVVVTLLMRLFRTLPGDVRAGWDLGLYEVMELYLAITALVYILVLRRRLLSADHPGERGA